jgi:hypothetical protein
MTEDRVLWLTQEVKDLLDVSSVGLYEFIWLLRGQEPGISYTDAKMIAQAALRQLLSTGEGRLILLEWPSQDCKGELGVVAVSDLDWDDPRGGQPYPALARN